MSETLHLAFINGSAALRRAVASVILGNVKGSGGVFVRRHPAARITVRVATLHSMLGPRGGRPDDSWALAKGTRQHGGDGLLDLARTLYGVPPGVVAVRLVEAALGLALDAEAARGVAEAIGGWDARGRPSPDSTATGPRA